MFIFLLILIGVFLNSTAQILLKSGVTQIGYFEFNFNSLAIFLEKIISNWPIIAGLSIYVLSVLLWLIVLSRIPVSMAYPITSIGYVLTALAGYAFLNEPLSLLKIVGIFVIMAGVYLVARA